MIKVCKSLIIYMKYYFKSCDAIYMLLKAKGNIKNSNLSNFSCLILFYKNIGFIKVDTN